MGWTSNRRARSLAHAQLGEILRTARVAAGVTTRAMGFSSGHVSNVEGGFANPSRVFVESYFELGADRSKVDSLLERIEHESRRARESRHRASRQDHVVNAPAMVDESTRAADIRRHYIVEEYDVDFAFDGTGAIQRVKSSVRLRATSNAVKFYFTGHTLDDSGEPPSPPQVAALSGGELARINSSEVGAFDIYFALGGEITPHDPAPHELSYTIEFDDGRIADPVIIYSAPPGAKQHTLTTRFVTPTMPKSMWWFGVPESYLIDRPESSARVESSGGGRYEHTFTDLSPGWSYGFIWIWNTPAATAQG